VAGFAQRRYEALAMVLERRLGRPCSSICGKSLSAYWSDTAPVHLIVGKQSDVLYQAKRLGRQIYPIASLTNLQGETTFRGLFVVRKGNPAQSLDDLEGYRILFGPASCDEKHAAAVAALREAGVQGFRSGVLETVETCTDAANQLMELADDERTAAVISDYAKVLLEGCHTIPAGSLRVIGKTEPIPFVTVFATDDVPPELRDEVRRQLLAANGLSTLLKLLESKDGFKAFTPAKEKTSGRFGWPDFRGPRRNALVPSLPDTLDRMRTAWTAPLENNGLGGVAATKRWVVVTDRDPAKDRDCVKAFDANTGRRILAASLIRPPGVKPDPAIDYGKSIRATPVIHDGRAYMLDAFGVLFVCDLPSSDSAPIERQVDGLRTESMAGEFKLATWGVASTPLIVDDKLVVNACGAKTSLLALELDSLKPIWKGPGKGTGYASCIAGRFGGRRQIVGYQSESLSGWDIDSGDLLWNVRPEVDGDYNVPSPVVVDERHLLVATENNAMRLYEFDDKGTLSAEPIAVNEDVTPDTVTPIAVNGFAYCTSGDELFRLDLSDDLKSIWSNRDKAFIGHVSLIADTVGQRLLVVTYSGEMLLYDISGTVPQLKSRRRPFGLSFDEEIYSHPALVDNRLYLRGTALLVCIVF
jgi:outer membrane protein assembly factor BamB/ABC-type phosphate/phosphonate transport system substrate-binding protein